jgi:hypothetical protein
VREEGKREEKGKRERSGGSKEGKGGYKRRKRRKGKINFEGI